MRSRSFFVAGAALLGALALPVAAHAEYTAWGVKLRSGPGPNYYVVGWLPAYAEIEVYDCQYGWCQVGYYNTGGWIPARAIIDDQPGPPPPPPIIGPPPPPLPGGPPPGPGGGPMLPGPGPAP